MKALSEVNQSEWLDECDAVEKYFAEQLGADLPEAISVELHDLRTRIIEMSNSKKEERM